VCIYVIVFELRLSAVIITEMAEDKKSVDPTLAGFYKAMERSNIEKITNEMLVGLSGDIYIYIVDIRGRGFQ
jgi:hypothetical protein